jgi:very-short-patch-repair endonuclease
MDLTQFQKQLRANQTDAEIRLWRFLRAKRFGSLKFKRQEIIGSYVVDFVCYEGNLIIELDGGQHYLQENQENDEIRTNFLHSRGFRVLRFSNIEMLKETDAVLESIFLNLMKN